MQPHTPTQRLDDSAMGGPIIGADRHPVRAFPPDRVCEYGGCSTRLSVYNDGLLCAAHDRLGAALCAHVGPAAKSRKAPRSSHRRAA